MISPLREHRLCLVTQKQLDEQRRKAGLAPVTTQYNAREAARNAGVQAGQYQRTLDQAQQAPKVTVAGGLTQAKYGMNEVDPYKMPDGNTSYLPKGATVSVPGGTTLPNGTTTPLPPQPKAPLPTASKVGPASTAYGAEDLKALATRRRNERLQQMGIDPTSEVTSILEKGGTYGGTTNGVPFFNMPDGTRVSANINDSTATALSGQDFSIAGEEQRIKDEQASATASAASTEIENKAAAEQGAKDANTYQPDSTATGALESAIQALGPEYAYLLPALRAETAAAAAGEAAADKNLATDLAAADASQSAYDKVLDQMRTDAATIYSSAKEFTEENQRRSEEMLAKQQESVKDQLKWQEDKATRDLKKANDRRVNQLVAAQALGGGFGSSNWVKTVAEAEWEGEQALTDLTKEFGFKRADVSIAFTESMNKIYEVYGTQKLDALKDFKSQLSTVNQYSFAATEKTEDRKTNARKEYQNTLASIADAQAKSIRDATKEVREAAKFERQSKIDREDAALGKIEYLLKNYPRESVRSAIMELGKDISSFDVSTLVDNPTLEELKKARTAVKGGSMYSEWLPAGMDIAEPEESYDDFAMERLQEMELEAGQSFTKDKKAQILAENESEWRKQYTAAYGGPSDAVQDDLRKTFGDDVLGAAQLVVDGTYGGTNPIKKSAEAAGVSEGAVAIAVAKLRQSGAIAETKTLSTDQQKRWDKLRGDMGEDTFYKVWNGSRSAITRISAATKARNNLADIAAINAFQNGIVDPGATVREGDVDLIRSAISYAEAVNLDYWKQRLLTTDGAVLPDSMRQKMMSLAQSIEKGYKRDYESITVPRYKTLLRQNGLPESVLSDFLGSETGTVSATVSPEVSAFVSRFQK